MFDLLLGEVGRVEFQVIDLNGNLVTGLTSANFTPSISRRLAAGTYGGTSEVLSFAETGLGAYTYTFTPGTDAAGYVYWLQIAEGSFALSAQRTHNFFFLVSSASAVYTEDDAFCSLADVQALVQRGAFSASSVPTSSQVVNLAAWRASALESHMLRCGVSYTVPSGLSPISSASQPAQRVLGNMLRNANAYGAASDAILCFEVASREVAAPLALEYQERFTALLDKIDAFCRQYLQVRTRTTSASRINDDDMLITETVVF